MRNRKTRHVICAGAVVLFALICLTAQAQVRIWEEPLTLPTYKIGAADKNPIFYSGRVYQGAKGPKGLKEKDSALVEKAGPSMQM